MLTKNLKRLLLISFDLPFSAFIWYVNASWGNTFETCLILSIATFLVVLSPFENYWSFRDLWFDRWIAFSPIDLDIKKVKVEVEGGYIVADVIKNRDQDKNNRKNGVIIVAHGFSDTREKLQYFYIPMVYQGYAVLAFDARGSGESKNTGKKHQFVERIEDYNHIIQWIRNDPELKNMKIYSVGFSIGAVTELCAAFANKDVLKIVAISSMSFYGQNMHKANPLVILNYVLKGVKLFPSEEENKKLSPYIVIQSAKSTLSPDEFRELSKRVMLIHCKNDKVIKMVNYEQNKEILESNPENLILLKKGGHSQKKNELALVGATLNFLEALGKRDI